MFSFDKRGDFMRRRLHKLTANQTLPKTAHWKGKYMQEHATGYQNIISFCWFLDKNYSLKIENFINHQVDWSFQLKRAKRPLTCSSWMQQIAMAIKLMQLIDIRNELPLATTNVMSSNSSTLTLTDITLLQTIWHAIQLLMHWMVLYMCIDSMVVVILAIKCK